MSISASTKIERGDTVSFNKTQLLTGKAEPCGLPGLDCMDVRMDDGKTHHIDRAQVVAHTKPQPPQGSIVEMYGSRYIRLPKGWVCLNKDGTVAFPNLTPATWSNLAGAKVLLEGLGAK